MRTELAPTRWRLAAVALAAGVVALTMRGEQGAAPPQPSLASETSVASESTAVLLSDAELAERVYAIDVRLADLDAAPVENASITQTVSRSVEQRLLLAERQRLTTGPAPLSATPVIDQSRAADNSTPSRVGAALAWTPIVAGVLLITAAALRMLAPRAERSLADPWRASTRLALPARHAEQARQAAA